MGEKFKQITNQKKTQEKKETLKKCKVDINQNYIMD